MGVLAFLIGPMQIPEHAPLTPQQRTTLNSVLPGLSESQSVWLSGFLAGAQSQSGGTTATAPAASVPMTVLYGTESGNAEALAERAAKAAKAKGFAAKIKNMADIKVKDLATFENMLVIVSTWGDGDPPDAAVDFHSTLMGDGAPKMSGVEFSVCALGDTSYTQFCKTGKDFDNRLEALGGKRLSDRVDCDVDFEDAFQGWLDASLKAFGAKVSGAPAAAVGGPVVPSGGVFDKKHPFPSELLDRCSLTGEGSSKETIHLELSLAGSGMSYDAGDALAVIPTNRTEDVEGILKATGFSGDETVTLPKGGERKLLDALTSDLDVTHLTKPILEKYNKLAASDRIAEIVSKGHSDELHEYLHGRQLVDALEEFPIKGLKPNDFVGILRKMPPRLYSIASSQKAHPDEVHLTVGVVRYNTHEKGRVGVCSTYMSDRVGVGETMPVYVHHNKNFRLPADNDTPTIMVGPGTGIAPFRSFVEEREAIGAKGKNWLFFGERNYNFDFLYQLEWQEHLKSGGLNRLDVAFSRDQKKKIYVQDRLLQRADDVWKWLEDGAHFYVCGDAANMAGDVHEALLQIAQKQGGKSAEDAQAWIADLKKSKRYQRDVY